jgi:hypothetical protein
LLYGLKITVNETNYSVLDGWINGQVTTQDLLDAKELMPNHEYGCFLGIERRYFVHDLLNQTIDGFDDAFDKFDTYLSNAMRLVPCFTKDCTLDHEDRYNILNWLKNPPKICCPVYLISVINQTEEILLYVGITGQGDDRFRGGAQNIV